MKWIGFAKNLWDANFEQLKLPYKLNFIITKKCNSRCVNCKIWQQESVDELSLEEIQKFAQNTPQLTWLNLTGGEPTDRPDLPEIAKAFIDACPSLTLFHFPTNGLRPNHIASMVEKIASIVKGTRFVVTVSIDGPPKINDAIRGIKGDFDKAIETYLLLEKIPFVTPMIGMTLYPKNTAFVEETFQAIHSHVPNFDYSLFHLNVGHVSEHYYGNTEKPPQIIPEMIQAIEKYIKKRGFPISPLDWIEKQFHAKAIEYLKTNQTPYSCAALLASCYLSENGTLYPCTIWNEPIGNIKDSGYSLEPLLNSTRAKSLRQKIKAKKCSQCWTPCEAYQSLLIRNPSKEVEVIHTIEKKEAA